MASSTKEAIEWPSGREGDIEWPSGREGDIEWPRRTKDGHGVARWQGVAMEGPSGREVPVSTKEAVEWPSSREVAIEWPSGREVAIEWPNSMGWT